MKRTTTWVAAVIFALCLAAPLQARTANDTEKEAIETLNANATKYVSQGQWDAFSNNLVSALKSEHDGLKAAAMQMIIRYNNQLEVQDGVFDVVTIYRTHEDMSMRRMALVTLGQMESDWAIGFLERADQFEQSPMLKQTLRAVVAQYHATHTS